MCFTAGASFAASAILGTGGLVALAKSGYNKQTMFAAIPLIFSIQQLFEGFLWKAIAANNADGKYLYTLLFLIFAQIIWPIWLPLSIFKMEENPKRKNILGFIVAVGFITSIMLAMRMLFCNITSQASPNHIRYEIESPQWLILASSILYVISIILPGFVSQKKGMMVLATILLLSLLISAFFFNEYLISVWCFFGALASLTVIFVIKRLEYVSTLPTKAT